MSARQRFCENHDGFICQGINGVKSIVQGFEGGGDNTNTPPTASDNLVAPQTTTSPPELVTSAPETGNAALPGPPPPPPPPPQIVTTTSLPSQTVKVSSAAPTSTVPTALAPLPQPELASPLPQQSSATTSTQQNLPTPAVGLASTESRGSFIEVLPTRTALSPVNNPLVPSIFASSDLSSITVGPGTTTLSQATETVVASEAAQGAIANRTTEFPTALVAGLFGGVLAFIAVFALLWRRLLRKQSQKRHDRSVADEKGLAQPLSGPHDPAVGRGEVMEMSAVPEPPISDQSRFSCVATVVSLDSDLEPLSPKPVIQQTVCRMSVPVPVEASTFRTNSKEASLRGSFSPPSSTCQEEIRRDSSVRQPRDGREESSTRLQVPAEQASSKQEDITTQPEQTQEIGQMKQEPVAEKGEVGTGLQRQYTLRTSPLHQNPFQDPVEEEPAMVSPTSLVFEIVNADAPLTIKVRHQSAFQGEGWEDGSLSQTQAKEVSEQQKDGQGFAYARSVSRAEI